MTTLVVIAGLLGAGALIAYVWTHRTGRLARGIGSAGATYNELYGQGAPPPVSPVHRTDERTEGDVGR